MPSALMLKMKHGKSPERSPRDDYPTPRLFTEVLLDRVSFDGSLLEPAAGRGDMLTVLRERYPQTVGRDLTQGHDFFAEDDVFDNIVTNPPFSRALDFVKHAISRSRRKSAILLPYYFIVAKSRKDLLNTYATRLIVVSQRMQVEMPDGNTMNSVFNHIWCVFEHPTRNKARRPSFEVA